MFRSADPGVILSASSMCDRVSKRMSVNVGESPRFLVKQFILSVQFCWLGLLYQVLPSFLLLMLSLHVPSSQLSPDPPHVEGCERC